MTYEKKSVLDNDINDIVLNKVYQHKEHFNPSSANSTSEIALNNVSKVEIIREQFHNAIDEMATNFEVEISYDTDNIDKINITYYYIKNIYKQKEKQDIGSVEKHNIQ